MEKTSSLIPTTDDLIMRDAFQERWISHPDSRLVINPFNFDDSALWGRPQADYCNRPTLPLNIGYLDPWVRDARGPEMKDALILLEKAHEKKAGTVECWNAVSVDTSSISLSEGTHLIKDKNGLVVKSDSDSAHDLHTAVFHCKLAATEKLALVIHIGELKGRWSLKVSDRTQEVVLKQETTTTGAFSFSSEQWPILGNSSVDIILSLHGREASALIDDLRILQGHCIYTQATAYSTSWQPHKSGFNGSYAGGLSVEGFDFLYDPKTVVRAIKWDGSSRLVIAGEYAGAASIGDGTIIVNCENYKYAIALNQEAATPKFYRSLFELMSGDEPSLEPYSDYGFFMFELMPSLSETEMIVSLALDTRLADHKEVAALAVKASEDPAIDLRLLEVKHYWDDFLAKIPLPGAFEFQYVDAKGVTPYDVRQMYYAGWVLLQASIAPANPEIGFSYRQLTAGKPCLWGYGDSKAVYTAAWDSLYGIQLLAYVNPETAWDAFTGIMSLVDEDGMLAGESLPVMRARTAWILYQCLSDKNKLRLNLDTIERNLMWGLEHPYWIWMGNNPLDSTLKDVDFTAAALVDIPYFIEICNELGEFGKAGLWKRKYDEFYKNYLVWTFPRDGSLPTQCYTALRNGDDGSGLRTQGITIYTTKSLHIKDLEAQYADRMMALFLSEFNAEKSLCGFSGVKLEEIQYTIYGLMEKGFTNEAQIMIEASVRDVVRSRFLGENYTEDDMPVCWGVRPSLFGVVQLADGIWLRNGFRYDNGGMVKHRLFGTSGYIKNVILNGKANDYFHSSGDL